MRIAHAISILPLLALVACSGANAATVDPNSDYDCTITVRFFRGTARIQGAPDKARQGLFVLEQWFATKWDSEHASTPDPEDHGNAIIRGMGENPNDYRNALKACTTRAAADPRFDGFARLVQQRMPDAR